MARLSLRRQGQRRAREEKSALPGIATTVRKVVVSRRDGLPLPLALLRSKQSRKKKPSRPGAPVQKQRQWRKMKKGDGRPQCAATGVGKPGA